MDQGAPGTGNIIKNEALHGGTRRAGPEGWSLSEDEVKAVLTARRAGPVSGEVRAVWCL